jgi:UV DNA damage endonuclease
LKELDIHADILDTMNISIEDGIINIHGGGVYGDKSKTVKRWIEQFALLPQRVKRRLTIENCEKCYSARDCLDIAQSCNIPMVFDSHHYECYDLLHKGETQETPDELFPDIIKTWKMTGRDRILCHISNQRPDSKIGAHSDYIDILPDYFLNVYEKYGITIDIDIEAKAKEDAILDLYKKYPQLL